MVFKLWGFFVTPEKTYTEHTKHWTVLELQEFCETSEEIYPEHTQRPDGI